MENLGQFYFYKNFVYEILGKFSHLARGRPRTLYRGVFMPSHSLGIPLPLMLNTNDFVLFLKYIMWGRAGMF